MTKQKSFKRLVRARMAKTGESYTTARTALLAAQDPKVADGVVLPMSDEAILRRTGRGWEAWFDILDAWGAAERTHTEIARWVAQEHAVKGWDAQSITVSFERASGRRAVGQNADGFSITVSKTAAVPIGEMYAAFVNESLRKRWLPDGKFRERTAQKPRSARFDWGDGETRVNVGFTAKGASKSTVALQHERLADAHEAERMKAYWRERVAALKEVLEG